MAEGRIERTKMKANIYDSIEIIVDYTGLTDSDINVDEINKLFDPKKYSREVLPLNEEEIEEYARRQTREISFWAKRNNAMEDNSIQYKSIDELKEVILYRNFAKVRLIYSEGVLHNLNNNFKLMSDLLEALRGKNPFLNLQGVYIRQVNQIYCKSLYQLFRCYDKSKIGTAIKTKVGEEYYLSAIQSKESFNSGDLEFTVDKIVEKGINTDTREDIYSGQLILLGKYPVFPMENIKLEYELARINEKLFDIFGKYLTKAFVEDIKKGKTDKVIGGFHAYETTEK